MLYDVYLKHMKELKFLQPRRILPALADKVDEFYLAGGTALSMMYYQHRESYDLDFFTRTFNSVQIEALVEIGRAHV